MAVLVFEWLVWGVIFGEGLVVERFAEISLAGGEARRCDTI